MAHFYLNESLVSAAPGASVSIEGAEARHAVTVSRIRVGESLSIGNGAGLVVTGPVVEADAARLVVEAVDVVETPVPSPAVLLVQALAKGDRDESAVQAATELGVDAVVPWAAQRSIVRWQGPKVAKGIERWRAIVREATKQSMRPRIPEVRELASTTAVAALASQLRVLVLEPTAEQRLSELELDGRDVAVVVGPEGGIAPAELEQLAAAGAVAVRLGDGVLRTSTAGPAAIAVLSARLGRW
ncbi:16S rRNA (uracil1498-N3)-methyltransferase [Homoserinimonas aerilata]|uniref:Ribosomal RNA small subunit methyltransferase E n=1 Tax=Homoserinimonas aerilata TaxID=1162970 RepID=A0A542YID5_9MICO|nr:16S rRNA (uracil(1498)-N(3))-methyltransferase [Homoserinimonas aerilata]TQL47832.1 16S rRNA (uracil1498-N3)-methyltransferase [Homoserinimonas aerilata]